MRARPNALAALAFLFAMPAVANAADLGGGPPPRAYAPPPPIYDEVPALMWTGFYAGVSFGYGFGETTLAREDFGIDIASAEPSGVLGALTLGYNYRTSRNIIIGVEGDLGLMDVSDETRIDGDHVLKSELGSGWGTIRARAGFLFGQTLAYGTVGAAFVETNDVLVSDNPRDTARSDDMLSGLVFGGGFEHAFSPNMSAKFEYLHMDFGSSDGFTDRGQRFSFENDLDLVRTGINYKF